MRIPELVTMIFSTEEFSAHCLLQGGDIVKLFPDNVVTAMVSRPPQLMAEIQRLHAFLHRKEILLRMHHWPSASAPTGCLATAAYTTTFHVSPPCPRIFVCGIRRGPSPNCCRR